MNVAKFTLSSNKVIYLREPVISDTEMAAQVAGKKAGPDNQAHMSLLLQKEMLKRLLVRIDEKTLSLNDKEQLEKLLSFKEYSQALKAMGMIIGEDSGNELSPEFTTTGEP
jgi:hypothetical protein